MTALTDDIRTGLDGLDELLGGIRPGTVLGIAGCTGIGSSVLALNIARHAALEQRRAVAWFALQDDPHDSMDRVVCAEATVDTHAWKVGMPASPEEQARVARSKERLTDPDLRMEFPSVPDADLDAIATACRDMSVQRGLDLVVIDGLSMLTTPDHRTRSRNEQINHVMPRLRELASELGVAVVVTTPLGRDVDARADHRPRLDDLEARGVAANADVVVLVHRDDYYSFASSVASRAGEAELIVAKNANGRLGAVRVTAELQWRRFTDQAH